MEAEKRVGGHKKRTPENQGRGECVASDAGRWAPATRSPTQLLCPRCVPRTPLSTGILAPASRGPLNTSPPTAGGPSLRRPTPVENTYVQQKPKPWLVSLLLFGVVLPVITLAFEYFTGMCAALLFDPLPTVWHILLVATVPLTNFLVWRAARNESTEHQARLGWLNGFAFGIGISRVAMLKYNIPDIRMLYQNDVRFLHQF